MKTEVIVDFGTIAYWKLFSLVANGKGFDKTSKNIFLIKECEEGFPNWCASVDQAIMMIIDKFNPDMLTIACDGGNLWRKKIYPEYKANRAKQRAETPIDWDVFGRIRDQHIKDMGKLLPMKVLLRDGIEADDIIGVLTKKLSSERNIIAVTGDADINQLFRYPNFSVYNPKTRETITQMDWMDMLNVKILSGDDGDNIPGVRPRTGPVAARKMITESEGDLGGYSMKNNFNKEYERNQKLINFEMIPTDIQEYIYSEYQYAKIIKPNHEKLVMEFSADYSTILDLFRTKLFKNNLG